MRFLGDGCIQVSIVPFKEKTFFVLREVKLCIYWVGEKTGARVKGRPLSEVPLGEVPLSANHDGVAGEERNAMRFDRHDSQVSVHDGNT
jgi:hypothetical protein